MGIENIVAQRKASLVYEQGHPDLEFVSFTVRVPASVCKRVELLAKSLSYSRSYLCSLFIEDSLVRAESALASNPIEDDLDMVSDHISHLDLSDEVCSARRASMELIPGVAHD